MLLEVEHIILWKVFVAKLLCVLSFSITVGILPKKDP